MTTNAIFRAPAHSCEPQNHAPQGPSPKPLTPTIPGDFHATTILATSTSATNTGTPANCRLDPIEPPRQDAGDPASTNLLSLDLSDDPRSAKMCFMGEGLHLCDPASGSLAGWRERLPLRLHGGSSNARLPFISCGRARTSRSPEGPAARCDRAGKVPASRALIRRDTGSRARLRHAPNGSRLTSVKGML